MLRAPRVVIKAGRTHDPATLTKSVEGTIGAMTAADTVRWLGGTRCDFP